MALEFVGAGEALAAEQPVADEGPLARVPSKVSLQVTCFPVDLATARNVAAVDVLLAQMNSGRSEPFRFLTVGTVAGGTAGIAALAAG